MINKMVVGRLGNQMFQYATMRALQEKNFSKDINLSFKKVCRRGDSKNGWENGLKYFNVKKFKENNRFSLEVSQILWLNLFRLIHVMIFAICFGKRSRYYPRIHSIEIKLMNFMSKRGIYYLTQGYGNFLKGNTKEIVLEGYFESSKYFDFIRDKLLNEFTPKYKKIKTNKKLYQLIEEENSVCVSIRCGDFFHNKIVREDKYICSPQYFRDAILLIQKLIPNPKFFFFSDDIEWVKNNLKFNDIDIYYESGKDPIWEKLRLMYSCKHFIISNSTFSWWAQYLSREKNKVVVAPDRWSREYITDEDIYEKNWKIVKC